MGLQSESRLGEPVETGGALIYPVSQAYKWLFSGDSGGLIWNRPSAVLVRTTEGADAVLPIQDVTRRAQIALLGLGLAGALLVWLLMKGK